MQRSGRHALLLGKLEDAGFFRDFIQNHRRKLNATEGGPGRLCVNTRGSGSLREPCPRGIGPDGFGYLGFGGGRCLTVVRA